MGKLTKKDFIDAIKDNFKSKKEAKKCLDDLVEFMAKNLTEGKKLDLKGLGRFRTTSLGKRKVTDPYNGIIKIAEPKRFVRFKPSESLRKRVNTIKIKQ